MTGSGQDELRWLWLAREGHRWRQHLAEFDETARRPAGVTPPLEGWQRAMLDEQAQFGRRCRDRFPNPERWLWTDRSLQQASDWLSATFKAGLIPVELPVIDACCGAGADLVALAQCHGVLGIDRSQRLVSLARANLRSHCLEGTVCCAEIPACLGDVSRASLHIDPDRRSAELRHTRGEEFQPPLAEAMQLAERARAAIIKLAPATQLDAQVKKSDWRRCWLGSPRECPQQILVRGDLHLTIASGQVAAALLASGEEALLYCGPPGTAIGCVEEPEEFVYAPHPALYASGLAANWAAEHDMRALVNARGYFTGAYREPGRWAQAFRVLDWLAWDDRRIRKWLRAHGIGPLEVKSRLLNLDVNQLQQRYSRPVGRPAVCLLTRIGKSTRAVMAERTSP